VEEVDEKTEIEGQNNQGNDEENIPQ